VWIRAVVLEDEVDANRGDVIAAASHPVEFADQFEVDLFWMSEHALLTALRSLQFWSHSRRRLP
jgi:sulfate adenylyltransferase subunit 1 (EFTu-like GTPase family)